MTNFIWGLLCASLPATLTACTRAPNAPPAPSIRVDAKAAPVASKKQRSVEAYSSSEFVPDSAHAGKVIPGPCRANVSALVALDGALFAAVRQTSPPGAGGVFRSLDKGAHFERTSRGLPHFQPAWRREQFPPYESIFSLAVDHGVLLAGSDTGRIFRSADRGEHWSEARMEPPVPRTGNLPASVWEFVVLGGKAFARVDHGVYASSDRGSTWVHLSFPEENGRGHEIRAIAGADGVFYAASPWGILVSKDEGAHITLEKSPVEPFELAARDRALYVAGIDDKAYESRDRARSFQPLESLFPGSGHGPLAVYGFDWAATRPRLWEVRSIVEMSGARYMTQPDGVMWTADGGSHLNWSQAGLTALPLSRVAVASAKVLVADEDGVWSAPLDLSSFERVRVVAGKITALSARGPDAFVGDGYGRVFESHDGGVIFRELELPTKKLRRGPVEALSVNGSHRLLVRGGILVSHDSGEHFRDVSKAFPLQAREFFTNEFKYDIEHAVVTDKALLLGGPQGLLRSDDDGAHFKPVELPGPLKWIVALTWDHGVVYAATGGELFTSHDDGRSFDAILRLPATPFSITSVAVVDGEIAITLRDEKAKTRETQSSILLSRDAGKTFVSEPTPLEASLASAPARGADAWYVGLDSDGLWRVPVHN